MYYLNILFDIIAKWNNSDGRYISTLLLTYGRCAQAFFHLDCFGHSSLTSVTLAISALCSSGVQDTSENLSKLCSKLWVEPAVEEGVEAGGGLGDEVGDEEGKEI